MNKLTEIIKATSFSVGEADYATVGDFWKNIVFFYKHDRFYYITKGEADIVLKGRTLHLKAGYLYYIPGYSVVTANCDTFMSHHFIHFEWTDTMRNFYTSVQLKSEVMALPEDESYFKRIEQIIKIKEKSDNDELELNGLMQIILSRFISDLNEKQNVLKYIDVMNYIDKNIETRITVKNLASEYNLNEVYFSNMFTKFTGISPSQYIINKKLEKAMLLLKSTDLSVKEISYSLGFNDSLYFSRLFKRKCLLNPTDFRNNLNKNE